MASVVGRVHLRRGAPLPIWQGCCECGYCVESMSPDYTYDMLARHMLKEHKTYDYYIAVDR